MSRYRCTVCHKYFPQPPYRRVGIVSVCSQPCTEQLMKRGPRSLVRSPIPPTTRDAVRARDRHRCRLCGRATNLHEHHIHYRSEGVNHAPDNLIVLCAEHHELVHSDKGRWQPVCLAYIADLYRGRQRYLVDIDRDLNSQRRAGSDERPDPTADP